MRAVEPFVGRPHVPQHALCHPRSRMDALPPHRTRHTLGLDSSPPDSSRQGTSSFPANHTSNLSNRSYHPIDPIDGRTILHRTAPRSTSTVKHVKSPKSRPLPVSTYPPAMNPKTKRGSDNDREQCLQLIQKRPKTVTGAVLISNKRPTVAITPSLRPPPPSPNPPTSSTATTSPPAPTPTTTSGPSPPT